MRVYTYKSPFEINKMSIWSEIQSYPHLCVSQTLVEGMKEYYGRDKFGVICTVEALLKKMYKDWHDDTENNIKQSIKISNAIKALPHSNLRNTMLHNKKDVINAIRYLIESDIDATIDKSGLPSEQQLLLDIYKQVEDDCVFTTLITADSTDVKNLHKYFVDILRDELLKYIDPPQVVHEINKITKQPDKDRRILREIDKVINETKNELKAEAQKKGIILLKRDRKEYVEERRYQANKKLEKIGAIKSQFLKYRDEAYLLDYSKIFIHGVHQFTPMLLKLIKDLEEMEIEVIFLFNYMSEYAEIYKTWKNVYSWIGENEEYNEEGFIEEGPEYLQGRELGYTLSHIYEGDFSRVSDCYDVTYTSFDNLTSFSDYVSQIYMEAVREFEDKYKGKKNKPTNEKLSKLALMKEQFYAINGTQMNELLKVYFPEQFSSRHFLSYPVGQFIRSLYKMWDSHKEALVITEEHIKEALALTVWNKEGMPTPLEIFYNIKYCFKRASSFGEYIKILDNIKKVVGEAKDRRIKRISIFAYSPEEIDYFTTVMKQIKLIAENLFSKNRMKVDQHYRKLVEQILGNETISTNITAEELDFVKDIKDNLEHLKDEGEEAYISDIKETIGYYLRSNSDSLYEAEWIVRDFEQIDGGVLLAAAQKRERREEIGEKTFHYAGLSDENMLGKVRVELPWPLDEEFFNRTESKIAEICSMCRSEYNYFLRYSLFYGTYFLTENKKIALSYIKKLGNKEANPYSTMSLINIEAKDYELEKDLGEAGKMEDYDNNYRIEVKWPETETERRSMRACFKRYLFNHCLDKDVYFSDDFYLEYICKFFIQYAYIRRHNEKRKGKNIDEKLLNKFLAYFPFFLKSDIEEIKNSIKQALSTTYGEEYINSKMEFIYKVWKEEDKDNEGQQVDLFKYFMGYLDQNGMRKVYKEFEAFIEENRVFEKKEEHKKKVCDVCNQRYLCLDREC